MREMMIDTRQLEDPQGRGLDFRYYVVVDEMKVAGGFACEDYGVRIAPAEGGEGVTIPHITTSISRIDELMELLLRNGVTPVGLKDVVADWL